jgi:ribosomal protein L11
MRGWVRARISALLARRIPSIGCTTPAAQACGIEVCAHYPGTETVAKIHVKQLYEIAKIKQKGDPNLKHLDLLAITRSLASTCKGFGVEVDQRKVQEHVWRAA